MSHWLLIASLYVTQFLPVSFFFMGMPAILRAEGRSLEELSVLYLLGFVWVVKVLWAPLVDRIGCGRLGHYRGWLILTQTAMIAVLLVISRIDGVSDLRLLIALSVVLTVFSATQDIATDALTVRLLPARRRSFGNSFQVAGGLLGIALGGGATLALYNTLGWAGCFYLMAGVLCLALVQVLLFREPEWARAPASMAMFYARLWRFWGQPGVGRWVLLMIVTPVGIGMVFGVLTPMLVDIGWSLESIGFTLNVAGSIIGLLAVFATGAMIQAFGRRPMVIGAAFLQALVILSLLPLASGRAESALVLPGLLLAFLVYNPIATVMLTIMMDHAAPQTAGTDFTAQYSLYSFMGFASGAAALSIAQAAGYVALVLIAAALALAAGLLAVRLCREKEAEEAPLPSLSEPPDAMPSVRAPS